ncbi:MAG: CBS domain-containing protein [Peptococcaceae bacterium]|nr:MAG: CBS domain-containing protein [Peptococcaceae bacterium]
MIPVKEVMVPLNDYSTISEDATVKEAIAALRASFHRTVGAWHGHQSLIVLNQEEELVGLLTLRSLLVTLGVRDLAEDIWIKAETWGWYFLNKLREQANVRVKDIMRPIELATVNAEDDALKASFLFFIHQVNSLPVLEKKKVVGILRTIDVFRIIKNML